VICLRKDHRLGGVLNLNGTSEQVEDERQVNVLGINKTCKFSYLSYFEVSVELIALVPCIVELISDCASYLQKGVCPGEPPHHREIEIVNTIKSAACFFPALRSERIVRKLKACVERVHVYIHS